MRTQNPIYVHKGNTDYIQISQQSRYFVVKITEINQLYTDYVKIFS